MTLEELDNILEEMKYEERGMEENKRVSVPCITFGNG